MTQKPPAEALAELRRTAAIVEERNDDLMTALAERDSAIARAAAAGLSRRRIAAAVGLSAARIQQICDGYVDVDLDGHGPDGHGPDGHGPRPT